MNASRTLLLRSSAVFTALTAHFSPVAARARAPLEWLQVQLVGVLGENLGSSVLIPPVSVKILIPQFERWPSVAVG